MVHDTMCHDKQPSSSSSSSSSLQPPRPRVQSLSRPKHELPFAFDHLLPRQRSLPLPSSSTSSYPLHVDQRNVFAIEPRRRRSTINAPPCTLAIEGKPTPAPRPPPAPPPPPPPPTTTTVRSCAMCGTTTSPEWRRKGCELDKSLCNACGLRYARTLARRQAQAVAGDWVYRSTDGRPT